MAEALLVSSIKEQLASLKEDELRLVGVDEEVKNLTKNFQQIKCKLEEAESKKVENSNVGDWLEKLQDTSYEIDDVLDEWITVTANLKIKEDENSSSLLKKVSSSISSRCYCSKQSVLRQNIAHRIKDLNKKLDDIVKEKDKFKFGLSKEPQTTSVIYVPKVFGRDYDKNAIINHMSLNDESSEQPTLPIISIVGMIGTEKTTLARLVFEDNLRCNHFEMKIWVSVKKVFDEIMIAKEILKYLKEDNAPNLDKLENLLREIKQRLEGKKFLLVLDDVWIENPKIWMEFMDNFKCASQGSRVLVTTCTIMRAKMMGTTNMIVLGKERQSSLMLFRRIELYRKSSVDKLSDMECWSLFREVAFSTLTYAERKSLTDIDTDIYKKIIDICKGSPFVVMILASLLSLKTKTEEWISVLRQVSQLEEMENPFPSPLLLSFYDLPSKLRKCFVYCAIFPKDYVIYKDKLIKLWMAQGYLKIKGREDMELVGEEYFANLAMRYFFQDLERSVYDGSIIRCKMHNTVHEFAQFLMEKGCLAMMDDSPPQPQSQPTYMRVLHVMKINDSIPISATNESNEISAICKEKKLRTLVVNRKNIGVEMFQLFEQLKCLRTLDLSECSIEKIPETIQNLLHLRYLNLSHNIKIEELPEALCELYNLQSLDLSNCYRLHKLPRCIGKLINLRQLINHRTCLSYMPEGIGKLSCLQTLKKFVVGNNRSKEKVGGLECLKNLKQLEGFLCITGLGNVSDLEEMNKGKLDDKEKLYGLSLRFDGWSYVDDEKNLAELKPPPNIEELVIQCYTGKTMPLSQISSLSKLRMLKLTSCFEFVELPSLGKLSSLESLIIENMNSVKKVGDEFLGEKTEGTNAFPKLKYLKFWNMEEWDELMWTSKNVKIMPLLRYLVLDSCPKLKSLSLLGELPSLESLVIKRMKSVKTAGNEFLGTTPSSSSSAVYIFPQLVSLELEDMEEWEEWNIKWEQRVMPNLLSLKFHSCPKLNSLPDDILRRPSLQKLIINNCPKLKKNYQKEEGTQWYRISHIPFIQIDSSEYGRPIA